MNLVRPTDRQLAYHQVLDLVEHRLVTVLGARRQTAQGSDEFPVRHLFTPGLYVRELTLPAMSINTSKVHRTEHPYLIARGHIHVFTEERGWVEIRGPHMGVTKPGTRRLVLAIEETVWVSFHPTHLTDLDAIEAEIMEPRVNPLLEGAA